MRQNARFPIGINTKRMVPYRICWYWKVVTAFTSCIFSEYFCVFSVTTFCIFSHYFVFQSLLLCILSHYFYISLPERYCGKFCIQAQCLSRKDLRLRPCLLFRKPCVQCDEQQLVAQNHWIPQWRALGANKAATGAHWIPLKRSGNSWCFIVTLGSL